METRQAIFLIGTGRSGSTVVFETLTQHEALAWFSNYNAKFPGSDWVSLAPRLYSLPFASLFPRGEKPQPGKRQSRFNRFLPKPSEVYEKWEQLCGPKFRYEYLFGQTATEDEKARVRRAVARTLSWQGKARFTAKITGPPRIGYLLSIFPDARFIHVMRDAKDTISSLMQPGEYYYDPETPSWYGALPEDWEAEWARYGRAAHALAAIEYRTLLEICASERKLLDDDQYFEIHYESFVARPDQVMNDLLAFCNLPDSARLKAYLSAPGRYSNQQGKYKERLSARQIADIDAILRVDRQVA